MLVWRLRTFCCAQFSRKYSKEVTLEHKASLWSCGERKGFASSSATGWDLTIEKVICVPDSAPFALLHWGFQFLAELSYIGVQRQRWSQPRLVTVQLVLATSTWKLQHCKEHVMEALFIHTTGLQWHKSISSRSLVAATRVHKALQKNQALPKCKCFRAVHWLQVYSG